MGFSREDYWSGLPSLSQGIFPAQGSNPGVLHSRQILSHLSYRGSSLDLYKMIGLVGLDAHGKATFQELPQAFGDCGDSQNVEQWWGDFNLLHQERGSCKAFRFIPREQGFNSACLFTSTQMPTF